MPLFSDLLVHVDEVDSALASSQKIRSRREKKCRLSTRAELLFCSCLIFAFFNVDEDGAGPAGEANQAGEEDDLDAKAVQAGENLDQFLSATAKETSIAVVDPLTAFGSENKELKAQIQLLGQDLNQARSAVDSLRNERDELRRQLEMSQQPRPLPLSAAASMGALSSFQGSPVHQRMVSSRVSSPVVVEEGPVCKVAERVRIRRLDGRDKLLTGSQIASFGVRPFVCTPL